MNALLILAVALIVPGLGFSEGRAKLIGWLMIGTGWANTLFYWAAMWAPNRALTFGANRFGPPGWATLVGLLPALVFALLSIVAVGLVALQAWRRT